MTAPRYGWGKGVYCRYEGEHSQRHLEETRAERQSSRLNMASRPHLSSRRERGRTRDEEERVQAEETKKDGEGEEGGQESTWLKLQGYIGNWGKENQWAGEV